MSDILLLPAHWIRGRGGKDFHLYFALFAGSVALFCLRSLMGGAGGVAADFLVIAGCATCGWSWLLTRALFQREAPVLQWPLGLVLAMIVLTALLRWSPVGPVQQMGGNVINLIGSTALLLALVEPVLGLRRDMARDERRFRLGFAGVYAAIMGMGVIWLGGAPEGSWAAQWSNQVKMGCALVGVVGAGLAVWYRGWHPLAVLQPRPKRIATDEDRVLGERVLRLMGEERLYAQASLKVAGLARRVGEAEYRVTQCITGALGFANFNQMVNQFRIEAACRMLSDPAYDHLPVLTIALDCGFGSIGPFNRAFKAKFETTPTAFRGGRAAKLG